MSAPQLLLHLGAPKCGSSALQAALTARPDHETGAAGLPLRYVGGRLTDADLTPYYGTRVRLTGRRSVHGYVNWPNLGPSLTAERLYTALRQVIDQGQRRGHIPILSCEGWIAHPEPFAEALAAWGHPPVEAVAYLRPPLDWVNAAWWQWGIWSAPDLDAWLNRGDMIYRFGPLLEAWAAIPNLRLHIRPARPDAVADFAALTGITLPTPQARNPAAPPSLTGFLLRNRAFRTTGHDAAVEFVVQRWCPPTGEPRPWAILPRHVHRLRPLVAETRTRLDALLSAEAAVQLFADPRWTSEAAYHDTILAGPSRPHDPEALPGLHRSLADGLEAVARALGRRAPPVPDPLGAGAPVAAWDQVLLPMLETLIDMDAAQRTGWLGRLTGRVRSVKID